MTRQVGATSVSNAAPASPRSHGLGVLCAKALCTRGSHWCRYTLHSLLATQIRSQKLVGANPHGGRKERRWRKEGLRIGGYGAGDKGRLTVPSGDTWCRLWSSQGGRWGERRARAAVRRKCSELWGDRVRAWRRSSRKRAEPGSGGGRRMSHRQMKAGVGRSVGRLRPRGTAGLRAALSTVIDGLYGDCTRNEQVSKLRGCLNSHVAESETCSAVDGLREATGRHR